MKKFLLAALVVTGACTKPTPAKLEPLPPLPNPEVTGTLAPQLPADHPALPGLKVGSRGPRRMGIDQLERSLDAIGNVAEGTVKLPPDLAVTLGRPDFRRVTEESLEPSPLFMKFMIDLSVFFCDSMAEAEATRPAGDRLFTRLPTIDENLSFLLLRFTSIDGDDGKPYLVRLRKAYDAGSQSTKKYGGYQAACMALFNSPEFLLY